MPEQNIIQKIKEAEKKSEERLEKMRIEANNKLNELRGEKEQYLKDIEKIIKSDIKKLIEEMEKDMAGTKMLHEKELENKIRELENIPAEKIHKAVDLVLNKLKTEKA